MRKLPQRFRRASDTDPEVGTASLLGHPQPRLQTLDLLSKLVSARLGTSLE